MNTEEEYIKNFNRKNPFRVPDQYFENFSDRVLQNIEQPEKLVIKKVSRFTWKKQLAMAAAIIGLAFLGYKGYYLLPQKNVTTTHQIAIVADSTDAEYSFVDEDHIVDVLTTEPVIEPKVEGDDIISYLVEDGVDENLIADAY